MSGHKVLVVFAFFVASFAAPSKAALGDEHDVCMGHPFSDSENNDEWISDLALKDRVSKRVASPIPSFQVNLGTFPSPSHSRTLLTAFFRSPPRRTLESYRRALLQQNFGSSRLHRQRCSKMAHAYHERSR